MKLLSHGPAAAALLLAVCAFPMSAGDMLSVNEGHKVLFDNPLPAMHITTPPNGTYNNYELGFPSVLTTSDPDLGIMLHQLRNTAR